MTRVFSGIQPTGTPHLGNWMGAISRWAADQQPEHLFCVVDLHAITVPQDPEKLRDETLNMAAWLFAAGLSQEVGPVYVQSHVTGHAELGWILTCCTQFGELGRMTQFKDKSAGKDNVGAGLFVYPSLMAADILLYQAEEVPVGDDQVQHLELTRDIAHRFNTRYGEVFTVPKAVLPKAGARIMDLQQVGKKMSKSAETDAGVIWLSDTEKQTEKKIKRAVTDSDGEIRTGEGKEGVTNLLDLFSAVSGRTVDDLVAEYDGQGYGTFKTAIAEATNAYLAPARERHAELIADKAELTRLLIAGAEEAERRAAPTLAKAKEAVGFIARA